MERKLRKIRNAIITDTFLGEIGLEIFTFYLYVDYGKGKSQKVGGYVLRNFDQKTHKKSIDLIKKILDIAEVDSWEELKNRPIRVDADFEKVYGIGNLLTDNWLYFADFLKIEECVEAV